MGEKQVESTSLGSSILSRPPAERLDRLAVNAARLMPANEVGPLAALPSSPASTCSNLEMGRWMGIDSLPSIIGVDRVSDFLPEVLENKRANFTQLAAEGKR